MEKVIVSREVANFIKNNDNGDIYWQDVLLSAHSLALRNGFECWDKDAADLMSKYSTLELAEILINGYEVEKTPHQELLEWYKEQLHIWGHHLNDQFKAKITVETIEKTLKILGLKVDGVNQ